tara:strand:- start:180 stop:455 length:276 start_codon:yes stop_codon:yes gene_type:complete
MSRSKAAVKKVPIKKEVKMDHHSIELEKLRLENDLQHSALSSRVDDLKDSIKDNREYFTNALSSLDKKVWTLVLLTISTLLTTVISMVITP